MVKASIVTLFPILKAFKTLLILAEGVFIVVLYQVEKIPFNFYEDFFKLYQKLY